MILQSIYYFEGFILPTGTEPTLCREFAFKQLDYRCTPFPLAYNRSILFRPFSGTLSCAKNDKNSYAYANQILCETMNFVFEKRSGFGLSLMVIRNNIRNFGCLLK